MVARCIDAGKGANHANRRNARQSVTAWLVAQDAELVAMISGIIRSSAAEMHGRTLSNPPNDEHHLL
jgi:hypothetical protein